MDINNTTAIEMEFVWEVHARPSTLDDCFFDRAEDKSQVVRAEHVFKNSSVCASLLLKKLYEF